MTTLIQRILEPRPGTASPIAGLFLWQLDDQSRRLSEDTRGAPPDELAWQPAPGMNTIGMLLAHIAAIEVGWVQRGILGHEWDVGSVLGVGSHEIRIPLPEDGRPPAALMGRDLPFFEDLLVRARAHTRQALAPLTDADLDRRFRVPAFWAPDSELEATAAWVLYHILEHEAGHYGQINLLRHQYRLRTAMQR